jgi:ABC-2 type transport system permease protein
MTAPEGQLFDLGYQRYDGPREGRMRARKALFVDGVRTSFGLGRGTAAKVMAVIFFIIVMTPAVILAVIVGTIDQLGVGTPDIPGHADYYQIVSLILLLFSAVIAPDLLCSDRKNGVISLYLVRPLSPTDYVIGRWLAFLAVSLVFIYAGQVVLGVALILGAPEPWEYLRDNWLDIPRFLAAGAVIAVLTTTIPLAVAAFTTRRAYASAFIIGFFVLSIAVGNILVQCPDEHVTTGPPIQIDTCEPLLGDYAKWAGLISVAELPIHISDMIFDKDNDEQIAQQVALLNPIIPITWYLIMIAIPGLLMWQKYRRLST